jgi:hypothetical protein
VPRLLDAFTPDGDLNMRAYANSLPSLLVAAGFNNTITAGGAGVMDPDAVLIPTGAQRHVLTKRGGLNPKTLQIIFGYTEQSVFIKGSGIGVAGWTLNAAGDFTATLNALVFKRISDPVLTPVLDTQAIPPFRRADVFLTWLTGSGESDDFSMSATNTLVRRKSFSANVRSYFSDRLFHGDERVTITGTIPKYSLDPDDLDALMAASVFAAKCRYKSDVNIGATAYPYSMWVEMPACQLIGGQPDELGNHRRFGASFDWWAAWDEASGYDVKITIVNNVPATNFEVFV